MEGIMDIDGMVDPEALRGQVKEKYREVALNPRGTFPFPHGAAHSQSGWGTTKASSHRSRNGPLSRSPGSILPALPDRKGSGWSIWDRRSFRLFCGLHAGWSQRGISMVWT